MKRRGAQAPRQQAACSTPERGDDTPSRSQAKPRGPPALAPPPRGGERPPFMAHRRPDRARTRRARAARAGQRSPAARRALAAEPPRAPHGTRPPPTRTPTTRASASHAQIRPGATYGGWPRRGVLTGGPRRPAAGTARRVLLIGALAPFPSRELHAAPPPATAPRAPCMALKAPTAAPPPPRGAHRARTAAPARHCPIYPSSRHCPAAPPPPPPPPHARAPPPAPARLTDALPLPRPTAPAKSTHLERSRYERRAHTEKGRLIRATPQNYRQPAALLVCLLSWRGVAHASPRRDVTRGGARARWAPSFGRKEEAGRCVWGGGGRVQRCRGARKVLLPPLGRQEIKGRDV